MIEEAEWARRLMSEPEPYYKRCGLVPIATILGTDNEELMKELSQAIENFADRPAVSTREVLPNLFAEDPHRNLRRQS